MRYPIHLEAIHHNGDSVSFCLSFADVPLFVTMFPDADFTLIAVLIDEKYRDNGRVDTSDIETALKTLVLDDIPFHVEFTFDTL